MKHPLTTSSPLETVMEEPLVSIALATYNGVRFLEQLLASIESQDYPSIEVVVSDDHSTDGTRRLLAERRWRRPHRIVESTERAGVIGNFSRALAACRGRYIALSDQDDYWLPTKISLLVERARSLEVEVTEACPVLVFSDIEVVDSMLAPIAPSFFALDGKSMACSALRDFLITNHVPGCSMLFNAALLRAASPIPTDFHMHDWWLISVAAALGKVACVEQPLLKYRQHAANVFGAVQARSSWRAKMAKSYQVAAWKKYFLPSQDRVASTVRNLRCLEAHLDGRMPEEAQAQFDLFRAGAESWSAAARHCLRAKTGERALYSIALVRSATQAWAQSTKIDGTPSSARREAMAQADITESQHS